MPSFAVRTVDDARVERWFELLATRLEGSAVLNLYFKGKVRKLDHGVYAVDVELLFSRLVVNVMSLFLAVGASLAWMRGYSLLCGVVLVFALVSAVLWNALWYVGLYTFVMRCQVWRLCGEWNCEEVTSVVFREVVVYGAD